MQKLYDMWNPLAPSRPQDCHGDFWRRRMGRQGATYLAVLTAAALRTGGALGELAGSGIAADVLAHL